MGLLPALPFELKVCDLTPELASEIAHGASAALNGRDTLQPCSLKNMNESCFASEACNRGDTPRMQLSGMLSSPIKVVGVLRRGNKRDFVGCVCAAPASPFHLSMFPYVQGYMVLSNLCVDLAHRKHGMGRTLVDEVRRQARPQVVHLFVAKPMRDDVKECFRDRVARLRATYEKLDFELIDECPKALLFKSKVS